MNCPICRCSESRVTDTRDTGEVVRRRRECEQCGERFTTYELIDRFRCPQCGAEETRVSGWVALEHGLRRNRECLRCGARLTSTERIDTTSILVVKKDGRREDFNRAKLLNGVRVACAKRPVTLEQMEALVDAVEAELSASGLAEVNSQRVGELVVERLRELDPVGYLRFASVYHSATDLQTLQRELEQLMLAPPDSGEPQTP